MCGELHYIAPKPSHAAALMMLFAIAGCSYSSLETRYAAAPPDERQRQLITELRAASAFQRWQAAESLGRLGDSAAIPNLIVALNDPDVSVRADSAAALGQIGDERAVEPLIAALRDIHPHVVACAAIALGDIGDARAAEPLLDLLAIAMSRSEGIRDIADDLVRALGALREPRATPSVVALMSDSNSRMRYYAAIALGEIGDPRALPGLVQALDDDGRFRPPRNDPVYPVAEAAVRALGRLKAVSELIASLQHANPVVRDLSAVELGQIADPGSVPALIAALHSNDELLRGSAAEALGRLGGNDALLALAAAREDPSPYVRRIAERVVSGS